MRSTFLLCYFLRMLIFWIKPFQATAASVSPSSCKETSTATQSVVSDGPAVNLGAPTAPGSGFNYGIVILMGFD